MQATKDKPFILLIDAKDECFSEPLSQFPNLELKTMHVNCLDYNEEAFTGELNAVEELCGDGDKFAIFHLTLGGRQADYTPEQNAEADLMDAHIAKTLESYGYQVTIIDAVDNACSLKMVNRISEILAS